LRITGQLAACGILVALLTGLALRGDAAGTLTARTAQLFQATCATCHLRPESGAPIAGQAEAWDLSRGIDALLTSTVNGTGRMPPLGMCGACSEDDLRELIRFMSGIDTLRESP
jgi:cytochrome c5